MIITRIRLEILGPKIAIITMPSVIDGIAMVTSVARITISSTTPPKYPANTPRSVPTTVTHTVPIKAILKEI